MFKKSVLVLTIRLVILAFILELGLCYSCRELSSARVVVESDFSQSDSTGGDVLTSGGLLGKGQPFEIIPEDEQKEVTAEDSEDKTDDFGFNDYVNYVFSYVLTKSEPLFIRNSARFYALPLFLVFHRWKFHI